MSNRHKIPDFLSIAEGIKKDLRRYAKVYCLQWFDDSFQNQGFTDASFQPWLKRKEAEFQFQYGAIKRLSKRDGLSKNPIFQFLYGAIKSLDALTFLRKMETFQFLYGAIKSWNTQAPQWAGTKFQFQYGAIKRFGTSSKKSWVSYFNSCMVRLRVR